MEEFIEKEGKLGEIQNAFRKGRRSTDSIYNLYQIIDRSILWERLEQLGFNNIIIRLFKNLYDGMRKMKKWYENV